MPYVSACLAILALSYILFRVALRRHSTIEHVPGPPSPSWIYGNLLDLLLPVTYGDHEFAWQKQYGAVYRIKACFGADRLVVSDPFSLQFILRGTSFKHGPTLENAVTTVFGKKALASLQGEPHQRARAILNRAFTANAVRQFQPVFERTTQMMAAQLEESLMAGPLKDICSALFTPTLSAIAEAAFGCTLEEMGDELITQHRHAIVMVASRSRAHILAEVLYAYIPSYMLRFALFLPTSAFRNLRRYTIVTRKLGERLVSGKLEASRRGLEMDNDIYSWLLHPDASQEEKDTMTAYEVAAQTAMFLIAGQETTANTLALGLYELAKNVDFQEELRAEIYSAIGGDIAYDSMPLLNAFIKETLRMHPVTPLTEQVATEDTVLPLSHAIMTTSGERISEIPIRRGQIIMMANASYQRRESLWGSDAGDFKPSRWTDGSTYKEDALGPYANLLSFLGGPRACLGWRFAILEMQVVIFELVRKFSFMLPEDDSVRPCLAGTLMPAMANGNKGCPLLVSCLL
ncbi:cytochrome P450 [Mycena leptocephala]|nr:cytochrome P450 [Mycena leptocephala]